jgi:hypothetical protein
MSPRPRRVPSLSDVHALQVPLHSRFAGALQAMLPTAPKSKLIIGSKAIIDSTCTDALGKMKHAPRIETDFTGSFVKNAVPTLNDLFSKSFSSYRVKTQIMAVYIHQTPKVRFLGTPARKMRTKQCELGDILLVLSHKRNPRKTYWRGALWQLKMNDGSQHKAADPQYWLYKDWPPFDVYTGGLQRGHRDFNGDTRSGYFGLVSPSNWLICPPAPVIGPSSSGVIEAGRFIVEMMYSVDPAQRGRVDHIGRRVFTRPYPLFPYTWSHTIWELLNITGAKQFNAKSLYDGPQPRISLLYSSVPQSVPVSSFPPPGERENGLLVVIQSTDATEFDAESD